MKGVGSSVLYIFYEKMIFLKLIRIRKFVLHYSLGFILCINVPEVALGQNFYPILTST